MAYRDLHGAWPEEITMEPMVEIQVADRWHEDGLP